MNHYIACTRDSILRIKILFRSKKSNNIEFYEIENNLTSFKTKIEKNKRTSKQIRIQQQHSETRVFYNHPQCLRNKRKFSMRYRKREKIRGMFLFTSLSRACAFANRDALQINVWLRTATCSITISDCMCVRHVVGATCRLAGRHCAYTIPLQTANRLSRAPFCKSQKF